jgi:hypothetical protein
MHATPTRPTVQPAAMATTWTPEDLEDGAQLCSKGFSADQAERMILMRRRIDRGEINEVAVDVNRLAFMRWLVEHGRVSDWPA